MVVIRKCTVGEWVSDPYFPDLVKEYADECAISILPSPEACLSHYEKLEQLGMFDVFCAYENDLMIGFISMLEYQSIHYGIPIGASESFFVSKDKRGTGAGSLLRKAIKSRAAERGLKGVSLTAPVNGPLAAVLENSDDCIETHRVFLMEVGNE